MIKTKKDWFIILSLLLAVLSLATTSGCDAQFPSGAVYNFQIDIYFDGVMDNAPVRFDANEFNCTGGFVYTVDNPSVVVQGLDGIDATCNPKIKGAVPIIKA